jgi:hypothetical protein
MATCVLAGLDGATTPRRERYAHLLGQKFGFDLVAQCAHRGGGRPDERQVQAPAELGEADVFGDEPPAHPHRISPGFQQSTFQFGVVEVHDARRCSAERHGLVSLAYEHGPALRVGMKSNSRYAAAVLGIQFSYRPNQADRSLASVDHCDSSWDCQHVGVEHSLSVWVRPGIRLESATARSTLALFTTGLSRTTDHEGSSFIRAATDGESVAA